MEFTLTSIKPWMRWPLFKWKIRRFCKASPLPASFESGGGGRKKFFLWRDHFLLILNIVMPLYSKLQKKHVWFFYSSVIHIIKLILGCHPYHADSLSRIGQLREVLRWTRSRRRCSRWRWRRTPPWTGPMSVSRSTFQQDLLSHLKQPCKEKLLKTGVKSCPAARGQSFGGGGWAC